MTTTHISVFGLFADQDDLEYAISRLKLAGFQNSAISCLLARPQTRASLSRHGQEARVSGRAVTGVSAGAALGGTLGWLAAIGVLAVPGVGPLIAAGPLLAALVGAGFGGAVGGVAGVLIDFGLSEQESKRFEHALQEGRVLLSIHCADRTEVTKAQNILARCGAEDIATVSEASASIDEQPTDVPPSQIRRGPMHEHPHPI